MFEQVEHQRQDRPTDGEGQQRGFDSVQEEGFTVGGVEPETALDDKDGVYPERQRQDPAQQRDRPDVDQT